MRARSASGMPMPWSRTSIRTSELAPELDLAARLAVLDRVIEQVEQHLLERTAIGQRERRGLGPHRGLEAAGVESRLQVLQQAARERRGVDRLEREPARAALDARQLE